MRFARDGSFSAVDVEPGEYQLYLSVIEPLEGASGTPGISHAFELPQRWFENGQERRELIRGGMPVGLLRLPVTIPQGPADEPFDLGSFEFKTKRLLKPGDRAPLFDIKTVGDKPLRLVDYRGKWVVLVFWTTDGSCSLELGNLRDLERRLSKDDRLSIVTLSLDRDAEVPKEFAANQDCRWVQGFLGSWSKSQVAAEYGVTAFSITIPYSADQPAVRGLINATED